MPKYYVSCGDYNTVMSSNNEYAACLYGLEQIFERHKGETLHVPAETRVSQRGFDEHPDDSLMDTALMVVLLAYIRENDGK